VLAARRQPVVVAFARWRSSPTESRSAASPRACLLGLAGRASFWSRLVRPIAGRGWTRPCGRVVVSAHGPLRRSVTHQWRARRRQLVQPRRGGCSGPCRRALRHSAQPRAVIGPHGGVPAQGPARRPAAADPGGRAARRGPRPADGAAPAPAAPIYARRRDLARRRKFRAVKPRLFREISRQGLRVKPWLKSRLG
jgi:hypothetical protein